MVCVLTNKKNVKRESESTKEAKVKKVKNETKISRFFSLPIGGVGVLQ